MKEMFSTTSNPLLTRRFILTKWRIFWLLLTFVGLLFTGLLYVAKSSNGQPYNILDLLNSQMLRFQIWALFSLIVVLIDHLFRRKFHSWFVLFPFHLIAGTFWAALVTVVFCTTAWFFDGLINAEASTLGEVFATLGISNLVMGIVGYKIILTTNYALDYYKRFQDERHRSALLEKQLAEAQLQALKMQLQPHFLFNTLNSISDLALENPRRTVQMIARLGDFLRLTIDNNGTQELSLERELEFLKCYLEIEQIRFRDRLRIELEVAPETLSARVPNLILQPLVENAIKHGIAGSIKAGLIRVSAEKRDEFLKLEIRNDGRVLGENSVFREGVGIANTRERLEQLYGNDFQLRLVPLPEGGAVVRLEIPFVRAEEEKPLELIEDEIVFESGDIREDRFSVSGR
ncbi:MAG: histidine kinase [Pyrinomonadaceae bacterium]